MHHAGAPASPVKAGPDHETPTVEPRDVNGAAEGLDRRVADRFEQVAVTSARLVAYIRTVAVVIIGLWFVWSVPAPRVYYYQILLAVFIVFGWASYHVSRRMGTEHWLIFVFAFIDVGLVTFAILSDNPFDEVPISVALRYRIDSDVFFFLLFFLTNFC